MTKREKLLRVRALGVILVILALSVTLFVTYSVYTEEDKKSTELAMNKTIEYVKSQCVRYDDISSENQTKSLVSVCDKARQIEYDLSITPYYTATGLNRDYLKELVEERRLTGIVIRRKTADGFSDDFYFDDDSELSGWIIFIDRFSNRLSDSQKIYSERIDGQNGYYYDYALLFSEAKECAVLLYVRQPVSAAEGTALSLSTLLTGFDLTDIRVVVTDGTTVIASNVPDLIGNKSVSTPIISRLRTMSYDNKLLTVTDDNTTYYAAKGAVKNRFIYVYSPENEVFGGRSVKMSRLISFTALFAMIVIFVFACLKYANKKQTEKQNKEYNENLTRLADEAIRANEAKSDFLRRMSHDIRTPINGIQGIVRIGDYYPDDLQKQAECRKKVLQEAEYLNQLVNDMLDMNKLDKNIVTWKDEDFSVTELFDEITSMTTNIANERSVKLTATLTPPLHDYVTGGAVPLKRILVNLITNAIKFSSKNDAPGVVEVLGKELSYSDGRAIFEFICRDNGIGIGEDFQSVMYEPFAQENPTAFDSDGGTGLGLAIVKRLVDLSGGKISVVSRRGEGAEFTLTLPFTVCKVNEVNRKKPETTKDKDKPLDGITVLSAEDNDLNSEITEFLLETAGARVITASDGKEALEKFCASKEGEIDVILMDVMMPGTDGITAAKTIRILPRSDGAKVPIIAVTANAYPDDVERVLSAGMNEHLPKPIDPDLMIKKIKNLVKEKPHAD